LLLCQLFDLMLTHPKDSAPQKYREFFKSLRERLTWNQDADNSPHLEAMVQPAVFFKPSHLEWLCIDHEYNESFRVPMEQTCLVKEPRVYADHLFSLVVLRFHYPFEETPLYDDPYDNRLVRKTSLIYNQSTGGRHHRIALLKQWMDLSLESPATEGEEGPRKMSLVKEIQTREFLLSAMKDCLKGFSPVDLASDENFCMYLRRRDPLMVVWLEAGLRSYRFALSV
jgi:hypothetical protein